MSQFDLSRVARVAGLCLSAVATAAAAAAVAAQSHARERSEPRTPTPLGDLKDFDGVTLGGPDTVLVRTGDAYSVKVEGDAEALETLDLYVEDHVLHVERRWRRGEGGSTGKKHALVHVTVPRLRQAALSGSGDLRIERMAGDDVALSLAGSGGLSVDDVVAGEAKLSLAGSGTLSVKGKVADSRVSIAGSGDVRADQLLASWTHVSIAGSGDAYVHASEGANVSIAGSGDALIRGTTNCRLSRVGSGDAHCTA